MESEHPTLRVGQIVGPSGLKGAVRIAPLTDFPDRFAPGSRLEVQGRSLTIAAVENRNTGLIVRFEEITDRVAAEHLQGHYLTVPLSDARPLPADRYYHFQLVGLTVVDVASGRTLGRVAEILTYPANDVLRVTDGPEEVLVPMVRCVVRSIDPDARRIEVDLPVDADAV